MLLLWKNPTLQLLFTAGQLTSLNTVGLSNWPAKDIWGFPVLFFFYSSAAIKPALGLLGKTVFIYRFIFFSKVNIWTRTCSTS